MSKHKKSVMSATAFKAWRRSLGLSQKEAAKALGLKPRIIQYYEKGERDGDPLHVPKSVRLACQALMTGIMDYDGKAVFVVPEGKTLATAIDKGLAAQKSALEPNAGASDKEAEEGRLPEDPA